MLLTFMCTGRKHFIAQEGIMSFKEDSWILKNHVTKRGVAFSLKYEEKALATPVNEILMQLQNRAHVYDRIICAASFCGVSNTLVVASEPKIQRYSFTREIYSMMQSHCELIFNIIINVFFF